MRSRPAATATRDALRDALRPGRALVLSNGKVALATDAGVFTATVGEGTSTSWSRLGTGLPNCAVNDLTPGPGGTMYAATHGRGIWRIQLCPMS